MIIEIEKFCQEDRSQCMKIEKENMYGYEGWRNGDQEKAWATIFAEASIFVLKVEGQVGGFVIFTLEEPAHEIHVQNLQINRSFQSHGFGSKLIARVEEYARSIEVGRIWGQVFKSNPALQLYLRLGYAIEGDGEEADSYRMSKAV